MNIRYCARWVRFIAVVTACLGVAANAATDTITLAIGKQEFAPVIYAGFLTGVTGSVSPATLSGSKRISSLAEVSQSQSQVAIDGFKSDPGQSWLVSVAALGVTKTGANAMYNYANGKATWIWSAEYFGFLKQTPGTKIPCTIVHE